MLIKKNTMVSLSNLNILIFNGDMTKLVAIAWEEQLSFSTVSWVKLVNI